MATKLEPEQHEELPTGWQVAPEAAPSTMRAEEPRLARLIGTVGFTLVLVGGAFLLMNLRMAAGKELRLGTLPVGYGLSILILVLGLGGLMFHAASDRDLQVRRMYMVFGILWLAFGVVVSLVPVREQLGFYFLPFGLIGLSLGLIFLLAPVRHETEARWRDVVFYALTGLGVVLALAGFIGSNVSANFLLPYGLVLLTVGLFFWWAGAGLEGAASDRGYRAALGMGALGLVAFAVGLGRSVLGPLFDAPSFLMPSGVLLMTFGVCYMALSAGLWSDHRLVVLTRRELAAFFYSPIAYIILFGFVVIAWQLFDFFVYNNLWRSEGLRGVGSPIQLVEPIIANYIVASFPIICVIFVVPVLTMRLLSEEQRTGTMEVMLTAPLGEAAVVVSKFLAVFIFYLLIWVPWGLFLVSLRVEGGQPFDYRPLLSFFLALAFTGAGFLSMGLFFSSLSRNQVAAAILTFVGMLLLTFCFFYKRRMPLDDARRTVLTHISYIDLWINSMEGRLAPRDLFYHLSAAVFWLFLTVKVLESRKWR